MNIRIKPHLLTGNIEAVPSKSQAHRVLLAAALTALQSGQETEFRISGVSEDVGTTARCVKAIREAAAAPGKPLVIDCGESGTTLRFLLPVCAALGIDTTFTGHGRLPARPLSPLREEMERHGVTFSDPADTGSSAAASICRIQGRLNGGEFRLAGNVSSQFISGLFFALPLLNESGSVVITTELESTHYIDMTLDVLREFGIVIELTKKGPDGIGNTYIAAGGQHFVSPGTVEPEGDWSNAAFWLAADSLGSDIGITGLSLGSSQGDKEILRIIRDLDSSDVIDAKNIPDLVPVIAVLAAVKPGTRTITNAARLRLKESDRLASMAKCLGALGADISERPEGLIIRGTGKLSGGTADGCGDHRVIMALAIAATVADGPVIIKGAEAVAKSYPGFFRDFRRLGGLAEQI